MRPDAKKAQDRGEKVPQAWHASKTWTGLGRPKRPNGLRGAWNPGFARSKCGANGRESIARDRWAREIYVTLNSQEASTLSLFGHASSLAFVHCQSLSPLCAPPVHASAARLAGVDCLSSTHSDSTQARRETQACLPSTLSTLPCSLFAPAPPMRPLVPPSVALVLRYRALPPQPSSHACLAAILPPMRVARRVRGLLS